MRNGFSVSLGLFVLAVLLGLLQLWFAPWSQELFSKLEMTVVALLITVLVVSFVRREQREDQANRRGDSLDDK